MTDILTISPRHSLLYGSVRLFSCALFEKVFHPNIELWEKLCWCPSQGPVNFLGGGGLPPETPPANCAFAGLRNLPRLVLNSSAALKYLKKAE